GRSLEQFFVIWNRLTGFSRLLTRRGSRLGLADHKRPATTLSGRENPAFGGPNQPISGVAKLVRCTTSHCASRLAYGLI
ncbi:MAG: hypothetical protein AAGF81_21220, partial [Pseudomonadota bacterium]